MRSGTIAGHRADCEAGKGRLHPDSLHAKGEGSVARGRASRPGANGEAGLGGQVGLIVTVITPAKTSPTSGIWPFSSGMSLIFSAP